MNPRTYQRVTEIFQQACEIPESERAAFLDTACGTDSDLRREVEAMFAVDGDSQATSVFGRLDRIDVKTPILPESIVRVGGYECLSILGTGGMGVVYLARQENPRREVAVKLINTGVMSEATLSRFKTEAELLGRLQHPGIAHILEAGTADVEASDGRILPTQPFIAMERIKGVPLHEHVKSIGVREEMALLAEICDAVQHAHQRSVAHLDLKPGNILIDCARRPKILDFGVAIALDTELQRTLADSAVSAAGTLAYMSPEQVAGDGRAIDTRADIHALGAIGFEMLTGESPHQIRGTQLIDAIQIVMTSAPRAVRSLKPDVDVELAAVIDKAIRPKQDDRYASAGELAADIRRWLRHEPVEAHDATPFRSARLFARRNRSLVIAGIVAAAAITIGVVTLVIGLRHAVQAESIATDRARDALDARGVAEAEAERAQVTARFLERVIMGIDPENGGGDMSFFEALDRTGRQIDGDLRDHPSVEAAVRSTLGTVYRRHSMYDKAGGHLRQALRIRREILGDDALETAQAMVNLADYLFEYGGQVEETTVLLEQADRVHRAHGLEGTLAIGWLSLDRGLVYLAKDDLARAIEAFDEAVAVLSAQLGDDHPDVSRPLRGLAEVAFASGDLAGAESHARQAVALCRGSGESYIEARAKLVLGQVLLARGAVAEADEVFDEVAHAYQDRIAPDHIRTAELNAAMTRLRVRQDRLDEAEAFAHDCLSLRQRILDSKHWATVEAEVLVQQVRIAQGEPAEDASWFSSRREYVSGALGDNHPLVIAILEMTNDADAALDEVRARRASRIKASMQQAADSSPRSRPRP